jgi:hypothetical protein
MATSPIVAVEKLNQISEGVQIYLNSQHDIMSPDTITSTRAVGDALQSLIGKRLASLLGNDIKDYSIGFPRWAMPDIAFTDVADFYHVVDIKTHRLGTEFNMPNLTSVKRLTKLYEDDKNYFDLILVTYSVDGLNLKIEKVQFTPIEHLKWDCLTIGALGWGQIQIANSNTVNIDHSLTRTDWMLQLCDIMLTFYPKEISKMNSRIVSFNEIKQYWLKKSGSVCRN